MPSSRAGARLMMASSCRSWRGILQPVGIAFLVTEFQRIDRHFRQFDIEPWSRRRTSHFQPLAGAHTHVIARSRNDEQIGIPHPCENTSWPVSGHLIQRFSGVSRRQERTDFRPDHVGIQFMLTLPRVGLSRFPDAGAMMPKSVEAVFGQHHAPNEQKLIRDEAGGLHHRAPALDVGFSRWAANSAGV